VTISHDGLRTVVEDVFGPTREEIVACVTAICIYKADPDTVERLFRLMKQIGFHFPGADRAALFLEQRMDEWEAEVKV